MARVEMQVHSGLRLGDLVGEPVRAEKLLSVRLPVKLLDELDRACRSLGARKSEMVVALLNEGLERVHGGASAKAPRQKAVGPRRRRGRRSRHR